nr:immunoglobulin heavy chain junction region [Macaca mulatta]
CVWGEGDGLDSW